MNGIAAAPKAQFRAGKVRVALWPTQTCLAETPPFNITVERRQDNGEYSGVLLPEDIVKAILTLKRANDYLTSSQKLKWQEETTDEVRAPERIP